MPAAKTSCGLLPQRDTNCAPVEGAGRQPMSFTQSSVFTPQSSVQPSKPRSNPKSTQVLPGGGAPSHCSCVPLITPSPHLPSHPDVSNLQSSAHFSPDVCP